MFIVLCYKVGGNGFMPLKRVVKSTKLDLVDFNCCQDLVELWLDIKVQSKIDLESI